MPSYEYNCDKCGLKFERRQAMNDAPLTECPECKGSVQRVVSGGAGFIMKSSDSCGNTHSCSMEDRGTTCCGSNERCGKPQCGA